MLGSINIKTKLIFTHTNAFANAFAFYCTHTVCTRTRILARMHTRVHTLPRIHAQREHV